MAEPAARGSTAEPEREPDRVEGAPHPREARALFGHEAAERTFLDAWAGGRLHHAWLIRGPRGVGKATLAYRIGRAVVARGEAAAPETLDLPPDHPVVRRVSAGAEPRLKSIRRTPHPEPSKRRREGGVLLPREELTVDVVRAARDFFHLSAADGGWRVAVVDPADEMNASAANALLKILEEPPRLGMLLLVSHAPGRLPPTIRSRCRALTLGPLDDDAFAAALAATDAVTEQASPALAALSGGSPGEALRLLAGDGLMLYGRLARLLSAAPGADRGELHALADACVGRGGRERLDLTLELTFALLRRLARAGAGAPDAREAAPGEAVLWRRLAPDAARARLWAETEATLSPRAAFARRVNLDPAGVILDTWAAIDAAAARALRVAA